MDKYKKLLGKYTKKEKREMKKKGREVALEILRDMEYVLTFPKLKVMTGVIDDMTTGRGNRG